MNDIHLLKYIIKLSEEKSLSPSLRSPLRRALASFSISGSILPFAHIDTAIRRFVSPFSFFDDRFDSPRQAKVVFLKMVYRFAVVQDNVGVENEDFREF